MRTLVVVALLLASTAIAVAQKPPASPGQLERYRQFQEKFKATVQERLGEGIHLTAQSISTTPDYITAHSEARLTWDGTTIIAPSLHIDLASREVYLPEGAVLKLPPKR